MGGTAHQAGDVDRARDPLSTGRGPVRGPTADHEHVRRGDARGGRRIPREAPGRLHGLMSAEALFEIGGKNALVTGGSRGIGRMIATGLLQAGARVVISS